MADRSRHGTLLQIIAGLTILSLLILLPILLSGFHPGPGAPLQNGSTVKVQILAINDFHGQLPDGRTLNKHNAGSAPVLASYLNAAIASGHADGTIIALPGDVVGSSPPGSGLLLDEPAILWLNSWANAGCTPGTDTKDPSCNMVATVGNHEFDKGVAELMRKIHGGNGTTNITHIVDPYPGAKMGYVCANVVWTANNTTILPPYTVRTVGGVPVAFIGAVTKETPGLERPDRIGGITFLDEAGAINQYIPEIQKKGVHAIVVLLHEGGSQAPYEGPTRQDGNVTGRIAAIIPRLDGDVDVVLTGHTHAFTNAYLENAGGKPVLVTQAYNSGTGFSDIDLTIDRASGEITGKSARIIPAYADLPPGTSPDPAAAAFLAEDAKLVSPLVDRFVAIASDNITREQNPAGEEALGDLVADAQRAAMKADVGFSTTGSIRADIARGTITWGDLYAVQPFANADQSMTLSGAQIRRALERQWEKPAVEKNLIVSGLAYTWDATRPAGSRVTEVTVGGRPLDPEALYTVSMPDYLAGGGDRYTIFREGTNVTSGLSDIEALVLYVEALPQPVNVTIDGRVRRAG